MHAGQWENRRPEFFLFFFHSCTYNFLLFGFIFMNLGLCFLQHDRGFFLSFSSFQWVVGVSLAIVIAGVGEQWRFYITASPFINNDSN